MLDFTKDYTCTYCGHQDLLTRFISRTKKGLGKTVRCRACNNRMKLKTLTCNMNPYDWGLWLYLNIIAYRSPHGKFYDRINWDMLWKNINMLGIITKNEFKKGFKDGKEMYRFKGNKECVEALYSLNVKYEIIKPYKQHNRLTNYL